MNEKVSMEDDGKRISGRYVVKDGMVTVTASNGRAKRGVIEDRMLSAETLRNLDHSALAHAAGGTNANTRCFRPKFPWIGPVMSGRASTVKEILSVS